MYQFPQRREFSAVNACSLHTDTHMTVGEFVMSYWTDLHSVDPDIKLNSEYYPDILMFH